MGFATFYALCLILCVVLTCFNIWWVKHHDPDGEFEGVSARLAICMCFLAVAPIINMVFVIANILFIWIEVLPKINLVLPNKK